jgi:hypothetical protein
MTRNRALIPLLLVLFIVLLSAGVRIVAPTAADPRPAVATRQTPVAATPTPTPPPQTGSAGAVTRSLAAVQRAFNAGDVALLCRSGALVDPAVIRQQNAGSGDCESELETLIAHQPPLRLTVQRVGLRPDLATADVATASGAVVAVDVVRQGTRWLLSFSNGGDPMAALAVAP